MRLLRPARVQEYVAQADKNPGQRIQGATVFFLTMAFRLENRQGLPVSLLGVIDLPQSPLDLSDPEVSQSSQCAELRISIALASGSLVVGQRFQQKISLERLKACLPAQPVLRDLRVHVVDGATGVIALPRDLGGEDRSDLVPSCSGSRSFCSESRLAWRGRARFEAQADNCHDQESKTVMTTHMCLRATRARRSTGPGRRAMDRLVVEESL